MRRPSRTKAQQRFDRAQRKLLRLRRAAVRWSTVKESDGSDDGDPLIDALTDLQAASDAYTESLTKTEIRRLSK